MAASVAVANTAKKGRKDPTPRHTDGQATSQRGSAFTTIVNGDPSKRYVLAWKADEQTGMAYYEALGYDVVLYHEGGPRLAGIKRIKTGDAVEFRGCVLMCIDKDEHARMEREGDGFSLGSAWADQLEARIRKQKRAENPFAGAPRAYSQSGQPYVMEDPDKSEDPEDLNNG